MLRSNPHLRFYSPYWEVFLSCTRTLWISKCSNSKEAYEGKDDILVTKMETFLKAGADPNARRSCLSRSAEDSALLWPEAFKSAFELNKKTRGPVRVYHVTELFLQHGVDFNLAAKL